MYTYARRADTSLYFSQSAFRRATGQMGGLGPGATKLSIVFSPKVVGNENKLGGRSAGPDRPVNQFKKKNGQGRVEARRGRDHHAAAHFPFVRRGRRAGEVAPHVATRRWTTRRLLRGLRPTRKLCHPRARAAAPATRLLWSLMASPGLLRAGSATATPLSGEGTVRSTPSALSLAGATSARGARCRTPGSSPRAPFRTTPARQGLTTSCWGTLTSRGCGRHAPAREARQQKARKNSRSSKTC